MWKVIALALGLIVCSGCLTTEFDSPLGKLKLNVGITIEKADAVATEVTGE